MIQRGFIFGAALVDRLGVGFVPVRKKKGKLPSTTVCEKIWTLEYGFGDKFHLDAFNNQKMGFIDWWYIEKWVELQMQLLNLKN